MAMHQAKIGLVNLHMSKLNYFFAAIALQLLAHSRQTLAQSLIPIFSQLLAQASQTSAHTLQSWWLKGEWISIRLTEVWQTSAQLIIRRKWSGTTCSPPDSRQ
ncbi:hypothetical protein BCL69_101622 [Nitrosomonas communis]|nr:hypothetical protein [Nitrosomonas communis]TYP89505.1 hypothetical protein BCL69_101622 [Nitrosomonas communis]